MSYYFIYRDHELFHKGGPYHINHSIDLQRKSVEWFLYDSDLFNERVKLIAFISFYSFLYHATDLFLCPLLKYQETSRF